MTQMAPDIDLTLLEELDFTPSLPCEMLYGKPPNLTPCDRVAEWTTTWQCPHCPNYKMDALACDPCKEVMLGDSEVCRCPACGAYSIVKHMVTRIERI